MVPGQFVPQSPVSAIGASIRIEIRRAGVVADVPWPISHAPQCAVWMAVEPLDLRAGTGTALARVIEVFREARAHDAYLRSSVDVRTG